MSDISPEFKPPQPNTERASSGKNADKSVKGLLKKGIGKVILGTPLAAMLLSSSSADNPNIHTSNIKEPTPADATLPENTSHNTDILQPYTPQAPAETPPNVTPTPEPTLNLTTIPRNEVSAESTQSPEQYRRPDALVIDVTKDTFANLGKYGLLTMSEEELTKKLGIEDLTIEKLTQQKIPEDVKLQLTVLAQIMKLNYGDHGGKVVRAMEETDKLLGEEVSAPNTAGLSAGTIKNFEIERDEIGNPTFWVELDSEGLAKIIAQSPQKFINLSLELGKVGTRFEIFREVRANPYAIDPNGAVALKNEVVKNEKGEYTVRSTYQLPNGKQIDQDEYDRLWEEYSKMKIAPRDFIEFTPIDAYGQKGNPLDSLGEMADLASKFPDKIFFAAAGNPTLEDGLPNTPIIVGAREQLIKQGKWPSNLFMIGYWGIKYEGEKYPSGYGADYYTDVDDLDRLGLSWGTSFATPVAERTVIDYFSRQNIEPTPDRVREMLDKYSESHEGHEVWDSVTRRSYDNQVYKVIDIKGVKEDLENSKVTQK